MLARVVVLLWSLLPLGLGAAAYAAPALEPQSSNEQGVTVKITPRPIATDGSLAFEIVLDTHSRELSEDLRKAVVLVTGDGKMHAPADWKGDGPGGHHRKGVLTFKAASPIPTSIELKLQRPGEPGPRLFRWELR